MKYAALNLTGLPTGFYSPDIHDTIPADAVEITEAQWQECIDNPGRRKITVAADGSATVEVYTPPPPTTAQLTAHTKAFAGNHITARLPEWKQRNLTARTAELLRIKSDRALTTEEQAEMDANQAEWDWVKSVRTFSDGLEADINAGTITSEAEIDGANWP